MTEVDHRFQDWLSCPTCSGDTDAGILAHETEIVIECYDCGATSEYTIGRDVPVSNLKVDHIARFASDD
ncbi:hypothetical protein [Natronorubrum sp. DTA28]|uniref:hypothetical protein n=1 Tax=Natronorubrum sp. DTA28 TaxID=3447019 RepID=UPI003F87F163